MPLQIIVTQEEHPVEPFAWQDAMALAATVACTLILVAGWSLVRLRVKQYPPLKSRTLRLSFFMGLFSLVHVWTTAISNNVLLGGAADSKAALCVLVNYWSEYFVGLCGWLTCLLLRMVIHGAIFHPHMRQLTVARIRQICQSVVIGTTLPLGILCVVVQFTPGVVYYDSGSCHTLTGYKVALAVWVSLACACVLAANRYLRPSGLHDGNTTGFFSEYGALKDIGYLGVLVIVVDGFVAVSGLTPYAWARSLFTFLVASLHAFAFLRLYGYRLWKALRRDESYVSYFLSTTSIYGQQPAGVADLLELPSVLDHFIDFCKSTASDGPVDRAGPWVLELFNHLLAWRTSKPDQGVRTPDHMAEIIRTYLREESDSYVNVPIWLQGRVQDKSKAAVARTPGSLDATLFDEVFEWLLQEIDRRWARPFFESLASDRMVALASEVELRALQQHNESTAASTKRTGRLGRTNSSAASVASDLDEHEEGRVALARFNGYEPIDETPLVLARSQPTVASSPFQTTIISDSFSRPSVDMQNL